MPHGAVAVHFLSARRVPEHDVPGRNPDELPCLLTQTRQRTLAADYVDGETFCSTALPD